MKPILTSKKYCSDWRIFSYFYLLLFFLFFLFMIFLILPAIHFGQGSSVPDLLMCGGVSLFFTVLWFFIFKSQGMILHQPVSFYETDIQIQPKLAWKSKHIPYNEISLIEVFLSSGYQRVSRGCRICSSKQGSITSSETFKNIGSVKEFIKELEPLLKEKGFEMAPIKEGKRTINIKFVKAIPSL